MHRLLARRLWLLGEEDMTGRRDLMNFHQGAPVIMRLNASAYAGGTNPSYSPHNNSVGALIR
jgi:hypothetical protein